MPQRFRLIIVIQQLEPEYILIHLILTTALQNSYACYSHFSDEDTDSQRC